MESANRQLSEGPTGRSALWVLIAAPLFLAVATVVAKKLQILMIAGATVLALWSVGWVIAAVGVEGASSLGWPFFARAHYPIVPSVASIWIITGWLDHVAIATRRRETSQSSRRSNPN